MFERKRRGLMLRWAKAFGFFQAESPVKVEDPSGVKRLVGYVRRWFITHAPAPEYDHAYRERWRRWFQINRKLMRQAWRKGVISHFPLSAIGRGYPRRADIALERQRMKARTPVQRLTNWQRNQWAAAGYPGMRTTDQLEAMPFVLLPHWREQRRKARAGLASAVRQ